MNIITLGAFDVLHAGHLKLLKFCKGLGDCIVGLNTDSFMEGYKGKPTMKYKERKDMLEELGFVVVPNHQSSGSIKPLLKKYKIDLIVVGSDWAIKDYVGQIGVNWEWLEEHGVGICYYPRNLNMSTTLIKERVKNG